MCDVVKVSESEFEYNVTHRKLILCLKDLWWVPKQVVSIPKIGTLFSQIVSTSNCKTVFVIFDVDNLWTNQTVVGDNLINKQCLCTKVPFNKKRSR